MQGGEKKRVNKVLEPALLLVDSVILGKKPGISCLRVPSSVKQVSKYTCYMCLLCFKINKWNNVRKST